MNTLVEAISAAITEARKPCDDESLTAVCLAIYDDSTFEIIRRCWPNTVFSKGPHSFYEGQKDVTYITVTRNSYPAQAWDFSLLEFCTRYSIRITDRDVIDMSGRKRMAAWEKTN
jgi:hypothetical protein